MAINDRPVVNSVLYKGDGTAVLVGDKGEIYQMELEAAIARGLISGHVGLTSGYISISNTNIVVVRGTTYTEITANTQCEVVSSSASDASAGTGTRTMRVTYYDQAMAGPFTEDITLNGTTQVTTSNSNICYVESIVSLTVGSNGTNVGTITLRRASDNQTIGTIAVSEGKTFWAHHYVGAGRVCWIKNLNMGIEDTTAIGEPTASAFLRMARPLTANSFEEQITPRLRAYSLDTQCTVDFGRALWIPGPARITMYARGDNANTGVFFGGFSFCDI